MNDAKRGSQRDLSQGYLWLGKRQAQIHQAHAVLGRLSRVNQVHVSQVLFVNPADSRRLVGAQLAVCRLASAACPERWTAVGRWVLLPRPRVGSPLHLPHRNTRPGLATRRHFNATGQNDLPEQTPHDSSSPGFIPGNS